MQHSEEFIYEIGWWLKECCQGHAHGSIQCRNICELNGLGRVVGMAV